MSVGWFSRRCKVCPMWHVLSYSTGGYKMDNDDITKEQKCGYDGIRWRKAFPSKKLAEQWRRNKERGMTNIDRDLSDNYIRRKK